MAATTPSSFAASRAPGEHVSPRAASARAKARPMPREAPVTSDDLAAGGADVIQAPSEVTDGCSGEAGSSTLSTTDSRGDLLDEARQDGSWAYLHESGHALGGQGLDHRRPEHRRRHLSHQVSATNGAASRDLGLDVVDEWESQDRRRSRPRGRRRDVPGPAS